MRYVYLLLLFLSTHALASAKLKINFSDQKVKQGSIVSAILSLNGDSAQKIQLNQLKGQTLAESFYVYSATPLMTKSDWDAFESEAKIMVIKIPESKVLVHKLPATDVEITWSQTEFIPTEIPKELIFGQFELPPKGRLFLWGSLALLMTFVVFLGLKLQRRLSTKKILRERRSGLKKEILGAADYDQIVSLWQRKASYLKEFPHLEESFRKLEEVLFKYQFKASRTEVEKSIVVEAYREFLNNVRGGFDGV